jgi:hypothetical protein
MALLCRSDKQKMNASLADLTGRVKELSRESALQCQQMGVMQDTVSYLSACVQQAGHHSPSSGIASEGDSPSLQDNQTGTRCIKLRSHLNLAIHLQLLYWVLYSLIYFKTD